jgi:hypothetical protein
MPAVNAIRALENLDEQSLTRHSSDLPTPGISIRIVHMSSPPVDGKAPPIIDAER